MSPSDPNGWKQELEIPGRVRFMEGAGDLPMIRVNTDWSALDLYLHGAHVTHFQKKDEPPLLFLSQVSQFDEAKPIRGGIPIILPWFGARDGQADHGYARRRPWQLVKVSPKRDGAIALQLRLVAEADPAGFPPLTADYTVAVRDTLTLQLTVTNNSGSQPLVFEDCLHSYFHVSDVTAVSLGGLKGARYLDKVDAMKEKTETATAVKISSEVDRVYLDTAATVKINDPVLRRTIRVEKENSASTVVWNPWIEKARDMADFGDDEYLNMVCVEAGNVADNRRTLPPGGSATLKVKLSSRA